MVWPEPLELRKGRRRIEEVAVRPLQGDDIPVAFGAQMIDQRGSDQAGGAGHDYFVGLVQVFCSRWRSAVGR